MSRETYKIFIFDFDGTLGDTGECVVASFQGALKNNNLPAAKREEIVHRMGLSLPQVFKELTQNAYADGVYDKLVEDYRKLYRTYLTQKTQTFPGVKDTLGYLKSRGALCTIATSKKTEFAKLSCDHLRLGRFIDLYIGDDKVQNKKPHPEMLQNTLGRFGLSAGEAVMIGDATTDIQMGKAIGMNTIAVTWGAHSKEALAGAEPTHIVDAAQDIMAFA